MTNLTSEPRLGVHLQGNLLGATAMMAWAVGFPAADLLMKSWDPMTTVAMRVLLASLPLLALWLLLDKTALKKGGLVRGLYIGGLGFGGGAITIVLAQWYTDPITVAIIAAASPLTATVVEWLAERRPLTRPFAYGLILSIIGGVIATGVLSDIGSVAEETIDPRRNLAFGAALAILSCFLFSWASLRTVRDLSQHSVLGQATLTTVGAVLLTWACLAVCLLLGWVSLPSDLLAPNKLGLAFAYGAISMAGSQLLWFAAVQRLGVSIASFHINVAPFYVMLIMLALGGLWSWPQAIGAAIVASGVLLAQRPKA